MQPPGRALAGLTTTTAARKAIIGNQFFMQTSFREFINNSSVPWFQVTNKIDDRLQCSQRADDLVRGKFEGSNFCYSWLEMNALANRSSVWLTFAIWANE
jgi:hypothetical protein